MMTRLTAISRLAALKTNLTKANKNIGCHALTIANGPYYFQKRTIINIAELKGTHDNLVKHKHLALLEGGVLNFTNILNTLYALAAEEPTPSAVGQLVTALFHKKGNQFRTTKNKSKPAYSLNSELLGKILHHIDEGTLNLPDTRAELQVLWRKFHKDATAGPLTINQINILIDKFIAAKQECDANIHLKKLTETILLSFIYFKADTRREALSYLSVFDRLQTVLVAPFELDDAFGENDIREGKTLLRAFSGFMQHKSFDTNQLKEAVRKHYETIVLTLMTRFDRLPQVLTSSYGYGDTFKANCGEATYHNICNIFLYNKKIFDFSLMPANLKPLPELVQFYQMQDYKTNMVNSRVVGQAFMDIVSKHSFLIYDCGDFELLSVAKNVLPLFNYLFGSTAANFAELSAQFSDERRTITFKPLEKNVEIIIKNKDKEEEKLTIIYTAAHTELTAARFRNNATADMSLSELAHHLDRVNFEFADYPLLLPLLYQTTNIDKILTITLRKPQNQNLEYFKYFFTHFYPRDNYEAFMMVHDILPFMDKFPEVEIFIKYLIKMFENILFYAAWNDNEDLVIKLLEYGVDPNARNSDAQTAIHAVKSLRVANILLQAGANPQVIDCYGKNPLHYCHSVETFKKFIELNVSPELHDNYGRTPLFFCGHDPEVTTLFLESGLDVNAMDKDNRTPIFYYADEGSSESMKRLISWDASVNQIDKFGRTALHYGKEANAAELFIAAGCNIDVVDENGATALHYALRRGHLEKAIVLLKANPNTMLKNDSGQSYLHFTLNFETTKLLLNLKAEIDAVDRFGRTPLHAAENFEVVKVLVNAGANLYARDKSGATAMHLARTREIAKFLKQAGLSLDVRDNVGDTPLHRVGVQEVVKFFLEAGLDPDVTNLRGRTPLHETNDDDIALMLLLAGANPNARDINLRTPLHRLFDFLDISVLLKKGANPNAKDIYKRTPLFYTFRPDVVTALINAGANPKARDIYGRSSLFYSYNDSIRTLLKTMGAPFEEQGKSSRFIKLIKDWLQDPAAPPSLHRKKY